MLKNLIKEILKEEIIGGKDAEKVVHQVNDGLIGKLVMVRTYSAGVHFGTLKDRVGKEVVLENAHRVHYWENACSLSQLSQQGSQDKGGNNRISVAVPIITLTEAVEVIEMSEESFKNLTVNLWKK